jgi:hypothetical protein
MNKDKIVLALVELDIDAKKTGCKIDRDVDENFWSHLDKAPLDTNIPAWYLKRNNIVQMIQMYQYRTTKQSDLKYSMKSGQKILLYLE